MFRSFSRVERAVRVHFNGFTTDGSTESTQNASEVEPGVRRHSDRRRRSAISGRLWIHRTRRASFSHSCVRYHIQRQIDGRTGVSISAARVVQRRARRRLVSARSQSRKSRDEFRRQSHAHAGLFGVRIEYVRARRQREIHQRKSRESETTALAVQDGALSKLGGERRVSPSTLI